MNPLTDYRVQKKSATFHGRDIYVYNGARLAAGQITFDEIGDILPVDRVVKLPLHLAGFNGDAIEGNIDITDVNFSSLWTNIPEEMWTNNFHATQGKTISCPRISSRTFAVRRNVAI